MLAVGGFAVNIGRQHQLLLCDPAVAVGDLLQCGDLDALPGLHHADELRGLGQRVHRPGIQPGVAAPQRDHVQCTLVQIYPVQVGDLQLAPGGWLQRLGALHDLLVIEVQAGDGIVALGLFGLFLDGKGLAGVVQLHHAEPLRVVDVVAEHRRAVLLLHRLAELARKARAVEDVVAQDHSRPVVPDELLTQDERLGQAVWRGLYLIRKMNAELTAISQQTLEVRQVGRR